MHKFNIGDKIMGHDSLYHDHDKPFYGEIKDINDDYGAYYYEIRGMYPIKNKLSADGCQLIWAWENGLQLYNEDKCNAAFINYLEIVKLQNKIKRLQQDIKHIILD